MIAMIIATILTMMDEGGDQGQAHVFGQAAAIAPNLPNGGMLALTLTHTVATRDSMVHCVAVWIYDIRMNLLITILSNLLLHATVIMCGHKRWLLNLAATTWPLTTYFFVVAILKAMLC